MLPVRWVGLASRHGAQAPQSDFEARHMRAAPVTIIASVRAAWLPQHTLTRFAADLRNEGLWNRKSRRWRTAQA